MKTASTGSCREVSNHWITEFQSAPAFIGRENGQRRGEYRSDLVSIRSRLYQAGELASRRCCRAEFRVSIRSRLYQAGELALSLRRRCSLSCFNPLPPLSGGRTYALSLPRTPPAVSIRSRLYQAGERRRRRHVQTHLRFNPLPPLSGGRTAADLPPMGIICWFQSAPAFIRRENVMEQIIAEIEAVSIRSRLYQAGEPDRPGMLWAVDPVSIRSRLYQAGEPSSQSTD